MASNNGKKGKKSILYYIVAALFLILSGALGNNQLEESTQDGYVSDIAVESQIDDTENEYASDNESKVEIQDENANDTELDAEIQDENTNDIELEIEAVEEETALEEVEILYTFRYRNNLESHYEKHGIEMGFDSPEEYLAAANKALANPDILHKIEAEDGDDVYYLEETNEFIVVSTDGYIRTYYYPTDGIDYFNRQ